MSDVKAEVEELAGVLAEIASDEDVAPQPEAWITRHGLPRARAYAALAKAQGAYLPLIKTRTARIYPKDQSKTAYEYKYADLADVLNSVRAALSANGLAFTQFVSREAQEVKITTKLLHESGFVIESPGLSMRADGLSPKEIAVVLSYARRYDASALLGVASEVDNDAVGVSYSEQRPRRDRPAPAPGDPDPANENQAAPAKAIENFGMVVTDMVLGVANCRTLPELQTVFVAGQKAIRKAAAANQSRNELAVAGMETLIRAKDLRKHVLEENAAAAQAGAAPPKIDPADNPSAGAPDNQTEIF